MTLIEQLKAQIRTLEADVRRERTEKGAALRRIALLEASARQAWAMAAWGGSRREAAPTTKEAS